MKAKNVVIATDLDGTLFYPKEKKRMISEQNVNFLRRFIDAGGHLFLVSGRNRHYLDFVVNMINRPVDYAGCNGSFIYINKKRIVSYPIDNKKIKKILEVIVPKYGPSGVFLMTYDYSLIVPRQEFGMINRIGYHLYHHWQKIYNEETFRNDKLLHQQLDDGIIYKVMLFFGIRKKRKALCKKAVKELSRDYPDYNFADQGQCLEITCHEASKANAIKQYLDYLKIKHDNVMVVGDSGNDISMLKTYRQSFVMSHAREEIKKVAKHTIDRVYDLERYLK